MAFFQELGKKIGEVAQDAQKKTSDLIEVNKLNSAIKDEKDAIAELHKRIGMTMYALYAAGDLVPESVAPDAESIAGKLRNIMNLESKIVDLKRDETKPAPAAANQPESQSGEASPDPVEPPSAQVPEEQGSLFESAAPAPGTRFCTHCGSPLVPGMAFCGQCGQRIG